MSNWGGDLSNHQFPLASDMLDALRAQVASIRGSVDSVIPNGTTFTVTFVNDNPDESTAVTIDANTATYDDEVYYNNTSGEYIYWACTSTYLFTVVQQKALNDDNDWICVTMLDY